MPPVATARQAVEFIHSAQLWGKKAGLENMRALLALLGNPEERLRMVHVAGTNGKGSVCALIERALRENGLSTGLYTSPFLCRYQERMRVSGKPIADDDIVRIVRRIQGAVALLSERGMYPTVFELGTALALLWFEAQKVDVAVIEVGLGGRLDPTNVITPILSAIATIGLDHTGVLGATLEEIAFEKAGIAKPGVPLVTAAAPDSVRRVFEEAARRENCPHTDIGEFQIVPVCEGEFVQEIEIAAPGCPAVRLSTRLLGGHQKQNLALAYGALLQLAGPLGLDMPSAVRGLSLARWPGRLERVEGVLLDGAHNPQGAEALSEYLLAHKNGRPVHLVCGIMQDKHVEGLIREFARAVDRVFATAVQNPRATPPEALARLFREKGIPAQPYEGAAQALEAARQDERALVVVAGSLYLVGEARTLLLPGDDGSI